MGDMVHCGVMVALFLQQSTGYFQDCPAAVCIMGGGNGTTLLQG